MSRIERLVRQPDVIKSYRLDVGQFSKNDLRRIAFHIRMDRPHRLFAGAWLMVEGKTETWLLNELAGICGYNLTIEGIQMADSTTKCIIVMRQVPADVFPSFQMVL